MYKILFASYWNIIKFFLYIYTINIGLFNYILQFYNNFYETQKKKDNLLFIQNSKIIKKSNTNNLATNYPQNYDYLIFKKFNENKVLIKILHNLNGPNAVMQCNFEFIHVIIKLDNYTQDITNILNNNKHCYYIIGAHLFNDTFMNWLFFYHLKREYQDYTIQILDNNIIQISIDKNSYLCLNENGYNICK